MSATRKLSAGHERKAAPLCFGHCGFDFIASLCIDSELVLNDH